MGPGLNASLQVCEPATSLNAARRRKPLIDLSDEREKLVNFERRFTTRLIMGSARNGNCMVGAGFVSRLIAGTALVT